MLRSNPNKLVSDDEFLAAMLPTLKYPSIREIRERVGLRSNQGILDRLNRFIKRGLVIKKGKKYYPNPHKETPIKTIKKYIVFDIGGIKYSVTDQKLADLIKSSNKLNNIK